MKKYSSHRIRRISSAALLSLAIYGTAVSPSFAVDVPAVGNGDMKIERLTEIKKTGDMIIGKGRVKSVTVGGLVVTREKDNKDFNITIDDKTKIYRRYEGKGSVYEIKQGHEVSVAGKIFNGDEANIKAQMVRDLSIEKRHSDFKGTVAVVGGGKFVLSGKGKVEVTVDPRGAKIVDKTGKLIELSDIAEGQTVKVAGLWDKTEKTLTEVGLVTDYSLPEKSK